MSNIEIFIYLLDEGIDVWRPTNAIDLGNGLFEVLATPDYDPEDETWEFPPGSKVKKGVHNGMEYLFAVEP